MGLECKKIVLWIECLCVHDKRINWNWMRLKVNCVETFRYMECVSCLPTMHPASQPARHTAHVLWKHSISLNWTVQSRNKQHWDQTIAEASHFSLILFIRHNQMHLQRNWVIITNLIYAVRMLYNHIHTVCVFGLLLSFHLILFMDFFAKQTLSTFLLW